MSEHDSRCGDDDCKDISHLQTMTPHARLLFETANPGTNSIVWAGWGFWETASRLFPEAKNYAEWSMLYSAKYPGGSPS